MKTKFVRNNDVYYNKTTWWFDESNEDSFSIFDLDSLYDENYFKGEHLTPQICEDIVRISKEVYHSLTKKELVSVLEAGSGGGWITTKYKNQGIEILGIEGSLAGYNRCIGRGLDCVIKADLRIPFNLNKKFDMVISTEVAEHIEPPFVSTYITNLINHSDLIWFSYNATDAHSNHHNCMPEKYWVNLFGFFGYEYHSVSPDYKQKLNHRLNGFFFNPSVYDKTKFDI